MPLEETVPIVELPPAVPFTDQVTEVLVVPETVAEKRNEPPARMLAVEGETTTVMEGGGGFF